MVVLFLNLIIFCSCMGILLAGGEDRGSIECPIWNFYNNITGQCECGSDLEGVIRCDEIGVSIRSCFCITFDNATSEQVVGPCLYTCPKLFNSLSYHHLLYNKITSDNITDLNNETCGHYYRKDTMCEECIEGYGVPVYSYTLSCVECSEYKYNWMLYIAVAYVHPSNYFLLCHYCTYKDISFSCIS